MPYHNLVDLKQIPLRAAGLKQPTTLDSVVQLVNLQSLQYTIGLPR